MCPQPQGQKKGLPAWEMARSQRWVPGRPPWEGQPPGCPTQSPDWAAAAGPQAGGAAETPTHSFVDGRKPVHERRPRSSRPPALVVMVVAGSFLPQGRRGHLSFLFGAPHPIFLSPLEAATVFLRPGTFGPWNPWVTVDMGDPGWLTPGTLPLQVQPESRRHRGGVLEIPSSSRESKTSLQGTF